MDFIVRNNEGMRTCIANKASATVVEAGDLVANSSGLIIKATAASTKIAHSGAGAGNGLTQIEVSMGNNFTLVGDGDAAFAIAQKGTEVDLVVNGGVQQVDVGASATDVFLVDVSENAGTVGSASDICVRINYGKAIF